MKPNATLRVDHFRWTRGIRVEVVSYWATEAHIRVRFPVPEGTSAASMWTLPTDSVKLDKGVKLEVHDAEWNPLQGSE